MKFLPVLLLVGAAVALALSNPQMDQFQDFARERSEELVLRETGDTNVGRFLANVGGGLAGAFVDDITERNNYVLFSTYTIGSNDDGDNDSWRFLGVGGQFIELERPE